MSEQFKDLNELVAETEVSEKFDLKSMKAGEKLEVRTQNTTYIIERREDNEEGEAVFYISGHPKLCPNPRKVYVHGSTFGGSALLSGKILEGGYLEFSLPNTDFGTKITSRIESFEKLND